MPQAKVALRRRTMPSSPAGFALAEVLVGLGICMIAFTALYASVAQAIRIAAANRDAANASQIVQQRLEAFRKETQWANVSSPAGLTTLMGSAPANSGAFTNATEVIFVEPYPTDGTVLKATRSSSGSLNVRGSSLSSRTCLQVTASISWVARGGIGFSQRATTIVSKGGL